MQQLTYAKLECCAHRAFPEACEPQCENFLTRSGRCQSFRLSGVLASVNLAWFARVFACLSLLSISGPTTPRLRIRRNASWATAQGSCAGSVPAGERTAICCSVLFCCQSILCDDAMYCLLLLDTVLPTPKTGYIAGQLFKNWVRA